MDEYAAEKVFSGNIENALSHLIMLYFEVYTTEMQSKKN